MEYQSLSSLQMALTNEIKRHFPQCSHNSRSFRGIQFKQQYAPLLRSDVKPSERKAGEESEEESPPLPSFPDDHLAV